MKSTFKIFIFLLAGLSILASCSDFRKIQKSPDVMEKYKAAIEYYNKKDYSRAQLLLDELRPLRGTSISEDVAYYSAKTNFALRDYLLAAYEFKSFSRTYPTSSRSEEASYLAAYCHYQVSPPHTLDQGETIDAIRQFQYFIKQFPGSPKIQDCNHYIDTLRGKLELKSFEICRQYYKMGDYKAAISAFNNLLKEFPDSRRRDEINYLIIRSSYLLSLNSVEEKKAERINNTIDLYRKFVDNFPKSEYRDDAEDVYNSALRLKDKLNKN